MHSSISIQVEDPTLGPLTFDALAAGDPALAQAGRLVVLLHGFPQTCEAFRSVLSPIASAGFYVVAPSQRGYSAGARPPDVSDYAIDHLVDDTLAIATALGADSFNLVGHDWGGAVAWAAARSYSSRLTSLTVLSWPHTDALTLARSDPADAQAAASAYIDMLITPDATNILLAEGATTFEAVFTARGLPADFAATYATALGTAAALDRALDWYRANDLSQPTGVGPTSVPTTYVYGTADEVFTQGPALATADLVTGAYAYVEVSDASHWLPETRPDAVVDAVLTQLAATS